MENIIEQIQEKGVIVYGGGRIGKQVIKQLKIKEVPIISVWDENAKNIKNVDKIELPNYHYKKKDIFIVVCMFSIKICKKIEEELRKNGFNNIFFHNSKIFLKIYCDYEKGKFDIQTCNRCVLNTGGCSAYIDVLKQSRKSNFNIRMLIIASTTKCTLNCRNCVQLTGEYRIKKINHDYDCEIFKKVWRRVEEVFGWITQVTFAAGELFLHKDWKSLITTCLDSDFVGIVTITTNGIYTLSKEDYSFLSNSRIVILLDDYTSKLNLIQKELFQQTKNAFIRFGVNFVLLDNNAGTWYEYGNFEKNNLEEFDLKELYRKCISNQCFTLGTDYRFYVCERANIANDLGYVDTTIEDSVDILNGDNIELIKEKICFLLEKKYLELCKYCAGCTKIVPPGEQSES